MTIHVVLDLETTGLDYKLDHILEVGAVRLVDGTPAGSFHALVNPGVELREANVAFHGITPELVAEAPPLALILPGFMEFVGEATVVAHNARFDLNFLAHHAALLGLSFEPPAVDTLELAREVFPRERALSLERLLELFGEPPRPLHRALADATALASIFPRLLEAADQRRAYMRSQFAHVAHVAARYRELGRLIESMQLEHRELRRTLELYFVETGTEQVAVPGGKVLVGRQVPSFEFHPEEARAVLAELGILERVLRLDREKLDRWLKGDRLTDEERDRLLNTRRFLGHRTQLAWEELPG